MSILVLISNFIRMSEDVFIMFCVTVINMPLFKFVYVNHFNPVECQAVQNCYYY